MRLIDADTLKAEFTGNFHELWHYTGIRALIDVAPTIDAELVKHGQWIGKMGGFFEVAKCSICGDKCPTVGGLNYCPHCGAKMDRESNSDGTN